MTQRLSKVLLALEAIVVVGPITLLFSTIALERFGAAIDSEGVWQFELLSFVIIVASLCAGWSLMALFWRRGSEGIRTSSRLLWFVALVGAAAAVIAVACLASGTPTHWPPDVRRSIWGLAWGTPLLLPLFHLLAERYFRSTANTSLERARGR